MRINDLFEGRVATWSNLISLSRILLAPMVSFCLYMEKTNGDVFYIKVALCLYLLIIFSDFLDGFLARLLNQVSRFGQFLDPVADKFTILIITISLFFFRGFPLWLVVLIILRDLLHVIGGIFLFYRKDIQVRPSFAGKCMVFFMGLSGFIYIINPDIKIYGLTLQVLSVYIILFFLVLSTLIHFKIYAKVLLD